MKIVKILLIVLMVALIAAAPSWAVRKTGSNGAKFLDIGVGARMVALGSAVTTIYGDVNSMFWNPAGIYVPAGETHFSFTYNQWIADISHNAFGVTRGFGDLGTFGLGVIMLGLSDISANRDLVPATPEFAGFQVDTRTGDTYDYMDLAIQLSYAKALTDRFTFGATLRYINETIDEEKANATAFDFGLVYSTGFRDLAFGARVNNLGSDIKFFDIASPLPLVFSIGASMSLISNENSKATLFLDATKPKDNEQALYGGAEYWLKDMLALRGGYKFNYSGVDKTPEVRGSKQKVTEEGFSFGGGLKYGFSSYELVVDYAFTAFGVFDNVHRFTLGIRLK